MYVEGVVELPLTNEVGGQILGYENKKRAPE